MGNCEAGDLTGCMGRRLLRHRAILLRWGVDKEKPRMASPGMRAEILGDRGLLVWDSLADQDQFALGEGLDARFVEPIAQPISISGSEPIDHILA